MSFLARFLDVPGGLGAGTPGTELRALQDRQETGSLFLQPASQLVQKLSHAASSQGLGSELM